MSKGLFLLCLFPKSLLALKILLLIIASDNEPRYIELQRLWKLYMHTDPEHIESYFLRADEALPTQWELRDDVLWSKTKESTIPGILLKTLSSFEYFAPRLNEFDFVIRTNLSSFYRFPELLAFLETLPKERCYAGPLARQDLGAASGCGIIFSPDVVQLLLQQKSFLIGIRRADYDDVVIWKLLTMHRVWIHPSRLEWVATWEALDAFKQKPSPESFHLRVGDPQVYAELVKFFY